MRPITAAPQARTAAAAPRRAGAAPVAKPVAARPFGRDVLARGAASAPAFETAYHALMETRDPKKANALLAEMKTAFAALRQEGGQDLSGLSAKLDAATKRAAALPVLYGLPDIPKPATVRNPESSSKGATSAQAEQARAWMNGYGASSAPAWRQLLGKLFPSLNPTERTPAFDRLPADQQAQFLAIAKHADAAGQVALHNLLVSERLNPALLAALAELAKAPVAKDVDSRKLLSQVAVEIDDPVTISQHGRGTCATTSVQILLAMQMPVDYVKLVRGLASPAGEAKLADGTVIKRESDWNADNDGGRSVSGRLMQPALMEVGNGALDYLNTDDMDRDQRSGEKAPSGLTAEQAAALLASTGLDPDGFETRGLLYAPDLPETTASGLDETIADARDMLMVLQDGKVIDPKTQDRLLAELKAQATPKTPVYATVIYTLYPEQGRVGFHAILVTGVKDGFVSYINPWGQEEKLPEAAFKTSIVSANVAK